MCVTLYVSDNLNNITQSFPVQVLILRDVPRAITLQDIDAALRRQGVTVTDMYRARQNVKIEVHCLTLQI